MKFDLIDELIHHLHLLQFLLANLLHCHQETSLDVLSEVDFSELALS